MSTNKDPKNLNNIPNQGINNNPFFSNIPPFLGDLIHNNCNHFDSSQINNPQNFNHIPLYNPFFPVNNNYQCSKCCELQNEIIKMKNFQQSTDMQIMLTNKNIELINAQIKLLDMKLSASIQSNKNNEINKDNNKKNYINSNNSQHNKNYKNKYNNFYNKNFNKNYVTRNKQIYHNKNNNEQCLFPYPTSYFLNENKNKNDVHDVIIQIDDIKPFPNNNLNYDAMNYDNKKMDSFNFLGPILSILEGIENKKKKNDALEQDENEDDISEYDSDEEFEELDIEIKTLDDLIKLGKEFEIIKKKDNDTNSNLDEDNTINKNDHTLIQKENTMDRNNEKIIKNKNVFEEKKNSNLLKNLSIKDLLERCEKNDSGINKINVIQGIMTKDGKIKFIKNDEENIKKDFIESKKDYEKDNKNKRVYTINGKKYSINLEILNKLVKPLTKLQVMIGLDNVKNSIVDMIMYYLQSFEKQNNNMLHTVIEGPPGVGKTELGKILAEIYAGLGIIKSNKFKLVRRSDLIGEYLGHTAPKTQKLIDEAEGGVLFIDEAYALGNEEKRDSFSKECIDVLNQNLSENKKKFICIIAGYPDELDKCFFSYNPGLYRRFPFRFNIEGYNPNELKNIFIKKVNDIKWKLDDTINNDLLTDFFTQNKDKFKNFGGDIDNLIINCKFAHSRRIFGKHPYNKRKFNKNDLSTGFNRFIKNKNKNNDMDYYQQMYA